MATDNLGTARKASAQCNVLVSVILAQWADETSYGASKAFVQGNNYAGVTLTGTPIITGVSAFPNKATGLAKYIQTLNHSTYRTVRMAKGWKAQCIALGESRWATGHYEASDPGNPGADLISIIQANNLTQYTSGTAATAVTSTSTATSATATGDTSSRTRSTAAFQKAYAQVAQPPPGFGSTFSTNQIYINGTNATVLLGEALITAQLELTITKASAVTLTIHDPTAAVINLPEFNQTSELRFGTYSFQLFGIEKSGSVLTVTFIPYVVAALMAATGAFTVAPETMTRTQFAQLLVDQIDGATFIQAPNSYLSSLNPAGYAHTTKEQLSRGTVDAPLESSWTALQRLAAEIQWTCYESFGTVYFGPYSYLTSVEAVFNPFQFTNGVTTITGTYTLGQPLGELTITCVADSWTPTVGQCVNIGNLGPFTGKWLVSEMTREDVMEPTITVTLQQPLPGLPTPTSGGTQAAVGSGAGNVQATGAKTIAKKALAFALDQVGKAYSETVNQRLGPNAYDCSGLVFKAYQSVGIQLAGSTTASMWPNGAGPSVPAGIGNLLPGDLLFFGPPGQTPAETNGHVAMVNKVTKGKGVVTVVEAADIQQGVITTNQVVPTKGAAYGSTLIYFGATRPATL